MPAKPTVRSHNIIAIINEMLAQPHFTRATTVRAGVIKDYCTVIKTYKVTYSQISAALMFLGETGAIGSNGSNRYWRCRALRRKAREYLATSPHGEGGLGPLGNESQNRPEMGLVWSLERAKKRRKQQQY